MNGAREYAKLFRTGRYGQLWITSGSHARGCYFHIYVVPKRAGMFTSTDTQPNDSVEVYGILGGHPGWTEYYGWLRTGPWQQDFEKLVVQREKEIEENNRIEESIKRLKQQEEEARKLKVLAEYESNP